MIATDTQPAAQHRLTQDSLNRRRARYLVADLLLVASLLVVLVLAIQPRHHHHYLAQAEAINNIKRIAESAIAYSLEHGDLPVSIAELADDQELPERLFELRGTSFIPYLTTHFEIDTLAEPSTPLLTLDHPELRYIITAFGDTSTIAIVREAAAE